MFRLCLFFLCLLGKSAFCLGIYDLSIAAIFKNEGRFLKEWIEYHRMVGVEHFFLYNDSSQDDYKEILEPYIAEGIAEIIEWPIPTIIDFILYQQRAYRDALKRSKGITQWLALIDIDEYLLPSEEATVTECLAKHFPNASGVFINWYHFGTGGVYLKKGESLLFGLTACSLKSHSQNSIGKSIVRPDRTFPEDLWNCHHFVLQPDAQYYNGDGELLYFEELDLKLDGKVHNQFIRLNHYMMRDELFFQTVKLPRTKAMGFPEGLIEEHYCAFNQVQDEAIINFILEKHPDMWEKFWKDLVYGD